MRLGRVWKCCGLAGLGLAGGAFGLCWLLIPFETAMLDVLPEDTVLQDRNGRPLRIRLADNEQDCRPVPLGRISEWIPKALIASEDKRYYRHRGVDPVAMVRALALNLTRGRRVSGASTVSTQVIRLAEPRPRTVATKVVEGIKAMKMERRLDKETILAQHLNRAPFGGPLTGVESASRTYFGKSAVDLGLGEASMLMGLIQAPSRLRPDRHPEAARRRQAYVLKRMASCGMISPVELERAQRDTRLVQAGRPFLAPHFCDLVVKDSPPPGPRKTTLDVELQGALENLLSQRRPGWRQSGIDGGAVVVLDVRTGAVRALIGSPDYDDADRSGQVNGAVASRSPGSALKPFAFAMAFDQGWASPASLVRDTPMRLRDFDPANFDDGFDGDISCRDALIKSLNIPALRMARRLGAGSLLGRFRELGLDTLDQPAKHYGLSLILGGGEVRLLDLANAYACLARQGRFLPYRLVEAEPGAGDPVFSEEASYLVTDILSGEDRSMDAFGHVADTPLVRFAWKTGTSSGFRDAWTMAYNPEYVVGVWLGNPDGRPASDLVGAETAAPLAADIFRMLYPDGEGPWYERPEGIRERTREDGSSDLVIAGVTDPACRIARAPSQVPSGPRIISPFPGSTFKKLDGFHAPQRIRLQAKDAVGSLYWFLNGDLLAVSESGGGEAWTLERGTWTFVCCDGAGRRDEARVVVE